MEQAKKASQTIVPDAEKLSQEIQDDARSIKLFNNEIKKEIDNYDIEAAILSDFIVKHGK